MGTSGRRHQEEALAKLTLSLRITGIRDDGYHRLDADMVTVDLADTLTFTEGDGIEITGRGADLLSTGDDNLVRRALHALGQRAHVRVEKRIPLGAGLGGGSADAAAVFRWAGSADLDLAAAVGADVPFCVVGGRARVRGIGEQVEPLPFEERTYTLQVSDYPLSTAAVYKVWDDLGHPGANGSNDLEPAALVLAPELVRGRDRLGEASGITPRLAGSGPTWFVEGAFPGEGRVVTRTKKP